MLLGKADPEALTRHPKTAGGTPMSAAMAGKLSLLPNGPLLAQPLSVLDSVAMARFLNSLRGEYDYIVLDCAAADSAADVFALARLADGVVAVASEARSKGQAVENLRQRLDQIGGHLVGGVFITRTRMPGNRRDHGYCRSAPVSAQLAERSAQDPPPDPPRLEETAGKRSTVADAPQRTTGGSS